ncbi:MAG: OmpA family protein [Nitrospiraceae bacterium]|nr:OmpA family protein [Nitrospiraceae bacterium]
MMRAAILAAGAVAFGLLTVVCLSRHLPPPTASKSIIPATFHARMELGTLTLRGSLPSETSKATILQRAQELYGAKPGRVVDELAVDPRVGPASWADYVPKVLPILGTMTERGSIIIDGRSVVLSGRVASEQAKTKLLRAIGPMTTAGLELEDHILAPSSASALRLPLGSLQHKLDTALSRNKIEFDSNKSTLTLNGRVALDQLIMILRDVPQATIEISGHTDGFGAPDYNMELSRRRADTVRQYFLKHGLTNPFTAIGYGATKPRSSATTQTALQKNRRIDLRVKGVGDL